MSVNMEYKNLYTSCPLSYVHSHVSTADFLISQIPGVGMFELQTTLAASLFYTPVSPQNW